jgi:hypothetical protein
MVYIKSFIAGIAALILSAVLFEVILLALALIRFPRGLYYDGRAIVLVFWHVSLPVAITAFALGFFWKIRRAKVESREGAH